MRLLSVFGAILAIAGSIFAFAHAEGVLTPLPYSILATLEPENSGRVLMEIDETTNATVDITDAFSDSKKLWMGITLFLAGIGLALLGSVMGGVRPVGGRRVALILAASSLSVFGAIFVWSFWQCSGIFRFYAETLGADPRFFGAEIAGILSISKVGLLAGIVSALWVTVFVGSPRPTSEDAKPISKAPLIPAYGVLFFCLLVALFSPKVTEIQTLLATESTSDPSLLAGAIATFLSGSSLSGFTILAAGLCALTLSISRAKR